jgi:RNA polymerase sigma-70 factor (ECF subfamily)
LDNKAQHSTSQQESDETLMIAYNKGDASAFDQLYQRHKVIIYRFFIRQNLSVSVAEELCHDTWLKIINYRKTYQPSALFTTYLFTIARRLIIDYQQKKSTQCEQSFDPVEDETVTNELVSDTPEPSTHANLSIALKRNITSLPFDQREVFLLKQESGFSIQEISVITQQDKEKVKSSWRYALQKLRKGLENYVI